MGMRKGIHFAGAAMIGARKRQEDEWAVVAASQAAPAVSLLAVVADGLGGHAAGDQASRAAVAGFVEGFRNAAGPPRDRLSEALEAGNRSVRRTIEEDRWRRSGMGTTLVAVAFLEGSCEWISVGDSFLFCCRAGRLEQLNPLHTEGADLDRRAARGEISWARARHDPYRAMLTSAVMGGRIEEISHGANRVAEGDVFVLASDGIETLPEDAIAALCAEHSVKGAAAVAAALIARIKSARHPRQDNATVVVVIPVIPEHSLSSLAGPAAYREV